MKRTMLTLAVIAGTLAGSAGAHEAEAYRNWGQCMSAWAHHTNDEWADAKSTGDQWLRGQGSLDMACVKIGDYWYLVPVRR